MSSSPHEVAADLYRQLTQVEMELCRKSFRDFVRTAWHIVEPGEEYIHGWHIDAICDHLTYVSLGDISDLVINIPPRHSKSLLTAVFWPAWEWTWKPSSQWLFATYAQDLTVRDSIRCRRLIQSKWYQERYGEVFQLSGDLNQKKRFDNTKNGYRLATSVGGTATGEGGSRIVVDDPHNMKEINSDIVREGVIEWWRNVMSTRGNNPKRTGRVIIAQRGHHMDLCGYVLGSGRWVHLNLPGYYRESTRCHTKRLKNSPRRGRWEDPGMPWMPVQYAGTTIFRDPRRVDDELLCPGRFGAEEMAKLAGELTERAFAAQIQQQPSSESGNIIKRQHWRKWDETELPLCSMVIQVYDTAFEEEEENDFSARTTWGIFEYEERLNPDLPWVAKYKGQKRLCAILLERWKDKVAYPELRSEALAAAGKWKPDRILIEKKASGHVLAQELKRAGLPVARIKTGDSKIVKAHAASLVFERGCVFYVDKRWADEVIDECAKFPVAPNDDITDTVVMAALWLRKRWYLEYLDEEDDDSDLMNQFRPDRKTKLYGGVRHG